MEEEDEKVARQRRDGQREMSPTDHICPEKYCSCGLLTAPKSGLWSELDSSLYQLTAIQKPLLACHHCDVAGGAGGVGARHTCEPWSARPPVPLRVAVRTLGINCHTSLQCLAFPSGKRACMRFSEGVIAVECVQHHSSLENPLEFTFAKWLLKNGHCSPPHPLSLRLSSPSVNSPSASRLLRLWLTVVIKGGNVFQCRNGEPLTYSSFYCTDPSSPATKRESSAALGGVLRGGEWAVKLLKLPLCLGRKFQVSHSERSAADGMKGWHLPSEQCEQHKSWLKMPSELLAAPDEQGAHVRCHSPTLINEPAGVRRDHRGVLEIKETKRVCVQSVCLSGGMLSAVIPVPSLSACFDRPCLQLGQ
ncbi:unnamed protein product [Pleuronectes platessa]|uniref:Uncharacterized protein n=1 Tax=Pleuronectes platessa TaxID=8262 RepID=A0A9N7YZG0_PLEPL|nr:unnamed protein product [Pleuronectes platessa]